MHQFNFLRRAFGDAREVATIPELKTPSAPTPEPPSYICGLDLGMVSDFSALAILEKTMVVENGKRVARYACRHLQRWIDTAYPDIAEQLRPLMAALDRPALVVDATGVGVGVVQILRRAHLPVGKIIPVTIVGGSSITESKLGGFNCCKREIVARTQSALQGKRLLIAPELKHAKTLRQELSTFTVKVNINTGNEGFEALRNGQHDDLVLACCLATWWGECMQRRLYIGGIGMRPC
jgi:hypothetical protein